ncbi:SDR family NAD(P)-dependent oxidoreductase [Comamonas endophytica]|uniref:SDR family oxidoreductase n=1 Tax=Comamonas endophytica TaxID=2949090 RepID=A0ABY6GDH3_9BURK|nr:MULTISPECIES: SDR family NAD(P)-dependent oxidoreductase [unclassified Acidovorax]MCD2512530.1 SDR family oxidoreductase [Acidovorax sp. D4N7]UYG53105.1 SDR family oxidoreductase [Acidovorax sp. 5MLIR]
MERFAREVVIVTGAGRGIGLAIAQRFMDEGAYVAIADNQAEVLEQAQNTLGHRERLLAMVCDVSSAQDAQRLAQQTLQRFGPVGVLVNNAGISPKHAGVKAPIAEMDEAEWRQVLDINLTGAFLCSQACLEQMKGRGFGRIVNIASQAGRTRTDIAGAHYAASKAGMMGLTRVLATEHGRDGITANAIAPGRIESAMAAAAGAAVNAAYLERIPVGRLGTPQDIAAAAAFLASREAGFISGATLDVNGGTFMI